MTSDNCATCHTLSNCYAHYCTSIQQMQDLAREAQDVSDYRKQQNLLEIVNSLQAEAAEILVAITSHKNLVHHGQQVAKHFHA